MLKPNLWAKSTQSLTIASIYWTIKSGKIIKDWKDVNNYLRKPTIDRKQR